MVTVGPPERNIDSEKLNAAVVKVFRDIAIKNYPDDPSKQEELVLKLIEEVYIDKEE